MLPRDRFEIVVDDVEASMVKMPEGTPKVEAPAEMKPELSMAKLVVEAESFT